VKRRPQCVDVAKVVKETIAVAVSRLVDRVFASHPRLKPEAKCCRSFAAKHNRKQRTKLSVIPGEINLKLFLPPACLRAAMINTEFLKPMPPG
jgi:hypothetical protein